MNIFQPFIVLNADYYTDGLRCAHSPGTPDIVRKHLWFQLADTILHEFAYAWYARRHVFAEQTLDEQWPDCYDDEPMVFVDDPTPEVGISWEKFFMGCSVTRETYRVPVKYT